MLGISLYVSYILAFFKTQCNFFSFLNIQNIAMICKNGNVKCIALHCIALHYIALYCIGINTSAESVRVNKIFDVDTEHFLFYFLSCCVVDLKVTYYSFPQCTRRFTLDTFHFTGSCGSFVYLNCNLAVYRALDPTSRCFVGWFIDFPR